MGSKNKNLKKSNKEAKKRESGSTAGVQVSGKRHGDKLITDSRFASVHSDPRFQKLPKHKSKVTIDSRFDRMFTDKSFTSSSAQIDKRGKRKKELSQNPLKHYYRLEEEKKKFEKGAKIEDGDSDSESSEESESESESESEIKREKLKKPGDGCVDLESKSELEPSESEDEDEESDNSSTDTTDSDEEDEVCSEEEEAVQEENIPEIDKETRRFAVVNMDWSQVKAVDLYVLLSSFLPKEGQILSVTIYPSDFGLKRMEEEAVHGPIGLFDDDDDDKQESEDEDEEIDSEKLRAYELSRLRYYYAVVECDTIATADYLYKTCDGVEFERSSNKLDLRFIPDTMEFKHPPRDVATEAPATYEGVDFQTRALQQSKIQLTWDDDEPHRAKTLKRKFNDDQLADLELKEFLASDESETDEGESDNDDAVKDKSGKKRKKQDMYRALIQSGDGSEGDDDNDEDGQDMEVTFNTGLEDISKRILEKKDKKSESVWETYLRKKREKKKERKIRSKNSSEEETSDSDREAPEQPDDFFVEEPLVKGKGDRKGKKNQELSKEEEASRAELELLLADDNGGDGGLKGYNLKRKKAKGKNGKGIPDESKIPTVDYDDPRFSGLFTSPLFALDPTDPQFKRSAAYARQLTQKQLKGGDEEDSVGKEQNKLSRQVQLPSEEPRTDKNEQLQSELLSLNKEKHELSSLVRSIKMKTLPSKNDMSRKSMKLQSGKSKQNRF